MKNSQELNRILVKNQATTQAWCDINDAYF